MGIMLILYLGLIFRWSTNEFLKAPSKKIKISTKNIFVSLLVTTMVNMKATNNGSLATNKPRATSLLTNRLFKKFELIKTKQKICHKVEVTRLE